MVVNPEGGIGIVIQKDLVARPHLNLLKDLVTDTICLVEEGIVPLAVLGVLCIGEGAELKLGIIRKMEGGGGFALPDEVGKGRVFELDEIAEVAVGTGAEVWHVLADDCCDGAGCIDEVLVEGGEDGECLAGGCATLGDDEVLGGKVGAEGEGHGVGGGGVNVWIDNLIKRAS